MVQAHDAPQVVGASAEALEAAAFWGGASGLRLIAERENGVYEAQFGFGRAALRLHRPGYQSEGAIRSELWWCAALAERNVGVPRALPSLQGELLHRLSSGRLASVIEWVEGPALGTAGVPLSGSAAVQCAQMEAIGRLLAEFHTQTDALTLPDWFERPSWDIEGLTGETPFWGRFWEHPILTPAERQLMGQARDALARGLRAHDAAGGDYGLVHADVLRENVLISGNGPRLIDFDDAGFGYRAYDLGTLLSQTLSEPHLPELARALVAGYESLRPVDRKVIPLVTLARCCASVGWTMPRLAPDHPVHRSHANRALALAQDYLKGQVDWWD